ncbi:MAG: Na/Pi symporter [Bacteroidia bacterium]|nr:Na/Pi symporter [Bacteroidia bacterium]
MKAAQGKFYGMIILEVSLLIIVFLVSVQWMVLAFEALPTDILGPIITGTSHPFIGFFIGLLFTAVVQSSATSTVVVVAAVAAGIVRLDNAVFLVMGANMGSTVTSTLVSLGHVTRKKEFRKAIAVATLHDFFNILTALILLPLEYYFGLLSHLAVGMAVPFGSRGAQVFFYYFDPFHWLPPVITGTIVTFTQVHALLTLVLAMVLMFFSLHFISEIFKKILLGDSPNQVEKYLFDTSFKSLLLGIFSTALVQSNSLISSLIIPTVAINRLSLKRTFPFLMGANLGSTLIALLAALSKPDAAISIACAHILFNVIGILIFYPVQAIRNIPIRMARRLGKATMRNRVVGFAYVILTFFIIPFFLIYFSRGSIRVKQYYYEYRQPDSPQNVQPTHMHGGSPIYPQRVYYQEVNMDESWLTQTSEQSHILAYQKADTLFIGGQAYLLGTPERCWQEQDTQGLFRMCLRELKKKCNSTGLFCWTVALSTPSSINHLLRPPLFTVYM